MQAIDRAFIRNAALILAAENWADGYYQAPEQHGQLMKCSARLERKVFDFFRDQAKKANSFINWPAYEYAKYGVKASRVDAYDVSVIVNNDAVSADDGAFVTVVFEDIAIATALGAQAGETIYSMPLGLDKADADIQRLVRQQVAQLVGKTIDEHGALVDNPNSDYAISNKTRSDIAESIRVSIDNGDDVQTAAKRLQSIIRNPRRAQLIAHQETVSAYAKGIHQFGVASGAVGKEWQDNGAVDMCAVNTAAGPIKFDKSYPSGVQHPTAHIGCKCYERLIYQNELDANPDLFGNAPIDTPSKPKTYGYTVEHNGVSHTFKLTKTESDFIETSGVKIQVATGKELMRGSLGEYNAFTNTLRVKAPGDLPDEGFSYDHTFKHELGHAIDFRSKLGTARSSEARAAINADKQNVVYHRLMAQGGISDTLAKQYASGLTRAFEEDATGRSRGYSITKKFSTYVRSQSEVFADGYAQYRANPSKFSEYAPSLAKFYKEMNK